MLAILMLELKTNSATLTAQLGCWDSETPCFNVVIFFSPGATIPIGGCILQPSSGFSSSLARFLDHIQRRATVGRTPLNE